MDTGEGSPVQPVDVVDEALDLMARIAHAADQYDRGGDAVLPGG